MNVSGIASAVRVLASASKRDITNAISDIAHESRCKAGDYSLAGEGQAVLALFDAMYIERGYALDIAAGDGVAMSCTLGLYRDRGWAGIAVECDDAMFASLARAYRRFPQVALSKAFVRPRTIANLLRGHGSSDDPDFLNVDIDSFDLALFCAIVDAGIRPKVVSIEINNAVPPGIYFEVLYTDEPHQTGYCMGCSLSAIEEAAAARGYILHDLLLHNAVLIRDDIVTAHGLRRVSAVDAYRSGYLDRPDRLQHEPWSRQTEHIARETDLTKAMAMVSTLMQGATRPYVLHLSHSIERNG